MKKRICLSGPSGTGKTTLAKALSEKTGIPYIPGSSFSQLLTGPQRDILKMMGYTGSGHKEVIQLSNTNPMFGLTYQTFVLEQRSKLLSNTPEFITDRSPLDNWVYFLLQCAHLTEEKTVITFFNTVLQAFHHLDTLIYLPFNNPNGVEDNKSRVANTFYQRVVSSVFDLGITMIPFQPGVLITLPFWDFSKRFAYSLAYIKNPQLNLEFTNESVIH